MVLGRAAADRRRCCCPTGARSGSRRCSACCSCCCSAPRGRGRRVLVPAVVLVAIAIWVVGSIQFQAQTPLAHRVQSLSPSRLETNAEDRYRLDERVNVIAEIKRHPVSGIGLQEGWSASERPLPVEHVDGRLYVHFALLWWWMKLGILGVIAFVSLLLSAHAARAGAPGAATASRCSAASASPRCAAIAGLLAVETTASFTGVDARFTVVFATQLGLLAVLQRGVTSRPSDRPKRREDPLDRQPLPAALRGRLRADVARVGGARARRRARRARAGERRAHRRRPARTTPDVHRELQRYWSGDGRPEAERCAQRLALERANAAVVRRHLDELRPDVVAWWGMGGMALSSIEQVRRAGLPAVAFVMDDWLTYQPPGDAWLRLFAERPRLGPDRRAHRPDPDARRLRRRRHVRVRVRDAAPAGAAAAAHGRRALRRRRRLRRPAPAAAVELAAAVGRADRSAQGHRDRDRGARRAARGDAHGRGHRPRDAAGRAGGARRARRRGRPRRVRGRGPARRACRRCTRRTTRSSSRSCGRSRGGSCRSRRWRSGAP